MSRQTDIRVKQKKGYIKHSYGDGESLLLEMRKPAKVFIVSVYKRKCDGWLRVLQKQFKTRKEAEVSYKQIYEEF